MKYLVVLLVFGISAFGQNAPVVSDQSTHSITAGTPRRGDRVFYFKDGTGSATREVMKPSRLNSCKPGPSDRVLYFKDSTGKVTGEAIMPSQFNPCGLSRGDRVFYFKDAAGNVPEKGSTSGQGTVDKK